MEFIEVPCKNRGMKNGVQRSLVTHQSWGLCYMVGDRTEGKVSEEGEVHHGLRKFHTPRWRAITFWNQRRTPQRTYQTRIFCKISQLFLLGYLLNLAGFPIPILFHPHYECLIVFLLKMFRCLCSSYLVNYSVEA